MSESEYKLLMQSDLEFRTEVIKRLDELQSILVRLHAIHERTLERVVENVHDFLDEERGRVVQKLNEMLGEDGSDDWWKEGREPPF